MWQVLTVIKESFSRMRSLSQLPSVFFAIPVVSLDCQEGCPYRI